MIRFLFVLFILRTLLGGHHHHHGCHHHGYRGHSLLSLFLLSRIIGSLSGLNRSMGSGNFGRFGGSRGSGVHRRF